MPAEVEKAETKDPGRKSAPQSMAPDGTTPNQEPGFIGRVSALPIVTSTVGQLAIIYERTKGSNEYVKYTLETAESGVKNVAKSAMPYVNKLEKPIGAIDSMACTQLDKLEVSYPIVTRPTEEILEESMKVYERTLKPGVDSVTGATQSVVNKVDAAKQYTIDTVTAVKDYGANKMNGAKAYTYDTVASTASYGKDKLDQVLETPGGQAVLSRVDQVLDKSDQYVEYYLPPEEKAEEPMEQGQKGEATKKSLEEPQMETTTADKPTDQAYTKLANVSDKVKKRMYAKALRDLQHVKKRSQETLEQLHFTVDLIEYAKSNIDGAKAKAFAAKDKFLNVWEEINKEEQEEGSSIEMENVAADGEVAEGSNVDPQDKQVAEVTFERRAILTARHLTRQLKRSFSTMMTTVYVLPTSLQTTVNDAKTFTENLYTNFANAKTLEDIPTSVVEQTRTHVNSLQETITRYTDYIRNNYFSSWLGIEGVEDLEEPNERETSSPSNDA